MRTFGYVVLLYSVVLSLSLAYVIREPTYNTGLQISDDTRQLVIELIKTLEKDLQTTENEDFDSRISLQNEDFDIRSEKPQRYGDEDDRLRAEKRDMGILPPWNELCRMMKITYCNTNRN